MFWWFKIIYYIKEGLNYNQNYSFSATNLIVNIIKTKQNEIAYSTNDFKINFFDINERKVKSILENISFNTYGFRTWFYMIIKDLLLIPGLKMINIINVNEHKKIREIDIPDADTIYGVCMLNSNMVITGDSNKSLRQWKIKGNNLIFISKKEKTHNVNINVILNMKNGNIATLIINFNI